MKIKQVYISDDNFNALKDINASALVNKLLTNHFGNADTNKMTFEEKQKEIAILEAKIEAKKKIEAIQNGN